MNENLLKGEALELQNPRTHLRGEDNDYSNDACDFNECSKEFQHWLSLVSLCILFFQKKFCTFASFNLEPHDTDLHSSSVFYVARFFMLPMEASSWKRMFHKESVMRFVVSTKR
jgi:hypothetical protein